MSFTGKVNMNFPRTVFRRADIPFQRRLPSLVGSHFAMDAILTCYRCSPVPECVGVFLWCNPSLPVIGPQGYLVPYLYTAT
jgi:hypothetical protein